MTGRRLRTVTLLALLAADLLLLLAATREWVRLVVPPAEVVADGVTAAGALVPLALAGLVAIGATAIAGPVFRVILGVLQSLLGVCALLQAGLTVSDPVAAAQQAVAEATGVAGLESIRAAVELVTVSGWSGLAIAAGILVVIGGLAVAIGGPRWPTATSRFQRTRAEPAEPDRTVVDDWDALSGGEDPTRGPR